VRHANCDGGIYGVSAAEYPINLESKEKRASDFGDSTLPVYKTIGSIISFPVGLAVLRWPCSLLQFVYIKGPFAVPFALILIVDRCGW
jgi:hypothetical protein